MWAKSGTIGKMLDSHANTLRASSRSSPTRGRSPQSVCVGGNQKTGHRSLLIFVLLHEGSILRKMVITVFVQEKIAILWRIKPGACVNENPPFYQCARVCAHANDARRVAQCKTRKSRPKRSHVQIFFKLAKQKGNDLLLPKRQKKWGVTVLVFEIMRCIFRRLRYFKTILAYNCQQ